MKKYRAVWVTEAGVTTKGILTDKVEASEQVVFLIGVGRSAWVEDEDGNRVE